MSSAGPSPTGLDSLLQEKAAEFELASQRYDVDGPMQDRALEIVKQFIIAKDRVTYGGLAVDRSLRLKGRSIYPDSLRPDYDFYSPLSVSDAYELADILHRAGFKNAGAIRAIHVQTMRVKIDFIFVADISYAPPEVFARFPTVAYEGMRVLHPDYQRLDMHLAFCFPFNGAPREDVFHRWRKDDKRFAMFQETYPIRAGALTSLTDVAEGGGPAVTKLKSDLGVDASDDAMALHGIAAFGLLLVALRELRAAAGAAPSATDAPDVAVAIDGSSVEVSLPAEHATACGYIAIASPSPERFCAKGAVQWYEPYMDSKPETAVVSGGGSPLHVFSTQGRQLAVVAVKVGDKRVLMVTPQYLLLHFLHEAHQARDEAHRDVMTLYYIRALDILREGADLIAATKKQSSGEFDRDTFINSSPFGLTTRVMGDVNHDSAYIIKMADAAQAVKDTPPPALNLGADIGKVLEGLPQRGYYPATSKGAPPKFDYSRNILFQRSGKLKGGPARL